MSARNEDLDAMTKCSGFLHSDDIVTGLDGRTVGDFWRWAYSDVLSNRNRSIFAEFIVGVAIGVMDKPRVEWDAVDLRYGSFKIEVKSSADCQSWHQDKPSKNIFSIRPALVWEADTGKYVGDPTRFADIYVFCHYAEHDKAKADVLDVPAWDFYVVPVEVVNATFGAAKSVSLSRVKPVAAKCKFGELRATMDAVLTYRRS
jgi:hypothetical protein